MRSYAAYIIVPALLAAVALPSVSRALTNDELLAQIAGLLAQVQVLQTQLAVIEGGTAPGPIAGSAASPGASPSAVAATCIALTGTLQRGSTGEEVVALQEFLARDPSVYPESIVSGYYGTLTERAVQRWQALNGVVTAGTPETTGYGVVGPKTRQALRSRCAGAEYNEAVARDLVITPEIGPLPLEVVATFSLNSSSCSSYILDWDDGSKPLSFDAGPNTGACTKDIAHKRATHTYRTPGVFQAALRAGHGPLSQTRIVNRISVSVGATVAGGFAISPTSGPAPLTTSITFPVQGSTCTSYEANWGDGAIDRHQPASFEACSADSGTEFLTHTYLLPGIYTVKFKTGRAPLVDLPLNEQWNIVVTDEIYPGAAVAIKPTTGNAPLPVSVVMGGRGEACTSYQLDWGDNSPIQRYESTSSGCGETAFEKIFTHTYTKSGTYTVRTKVGKGPLAGLSISEEVVIIGAEQTVNTCPYPDEQVCGEVLNTCPAGYTCGEDIRTFSDRCIMEDAGAVFRYSGACQ